MLFNPEVTKQAQKVFSPKSPRVTHPTVYFNNSPVICSSSQKHVVVHLNEKHNFIHHIKLKSYYYFQLKISKANKGVGAIKN